MFSSLGNPSPLLGSRLQKNVLSSKMVGIAQSLTELCELSLSFKVNDIAESLTEMQTLSQDQ